MQALLKDRILISDLCKILDTYMPKNQVAIVYQAYMTAASAHEGQYRYSGEAYVFHPISVAMILAKLQLDCDCIVAALLHDCIEDTLLTQDNIATQFGDEVAHIVQGVSKLTGLEFHSHTDKQAQNFRKLFLAMSADMRVMIIKLADRLHNMRTLKSVPRYKQLRIAKETAEIHAPIARRLGLNSIRTELDDLCFAMIHPYRYQVLAKQIKKQCGNRKKTVQSIQDEIINRFKQESLHTKEITGRSKQPYSIYKKMSSKHLKFSEVLDMYAFRIIVADVGRCYQALGIIHNLYKPLPGKFKDYVALPKINGYQSLHTVLLGPKKIFIEVQIRSADMNFIAEHGIAAHWHYKNNPTAPSTLANNWLGSLLDIGNNSNTSDQFLEETKIDLFPSEVFVFTPQGDIVQLPHTSTLLDFAYALHTSIGNMTIAGKVDKVKVDISTRLKSGQMVEIITDKNAKPHPSWLQIVTTAKAKSSIKSKLKNKSGGELIRLGEYLLTNALDYQGIDKNTIKQQAWQRCLDDLKCDSKQDLYTKIGLSEVFVSVALNKLQNKTNQHLQSIVIRQTRDKSISFAHCCHPIPGDRVAGILTATKGLVMHRFDCGNLIHAKQKKAQWLQIDWHADKDEVFEVLISIEVENRRGILAGVANTIAKMEINIENFEVQEKDNFIKALNFTITVADTDKLARVFDALNTLKFVRSVSRI